MVRELGMTRNLSALQTKTVPTQILKKPKETA